LGATRNGIKTFSIISLSTQLASSIIRTEARKPRIFSPAKVLGTLTEDEVEFDYNPPKQLINAASRINTALADNTIEKDSWLKNNTLKQYLESTIKFCHYYRFKLTASKLTDKTERTLFESTYIAHIWNKTDLTSEELDLYIYVAENMVNGLRLDSEILIYSAFLEDATHEKDGKTTSMAISEHLASLRKEKGDIEKRQKELIKDLQGKRSDRVTQKMKENASVLNLVEAWRNEAKRKELIEGRKAEKERLNDELDRLDNMDAVKALIAGIDRKDLLA